MIQHFLQNSAQQYPDKNALWYKDKWITYGEIDRMSDAVAFWLRSTGTKQGDRVAILLENSFDYVIAYYGVLKAGAVVVALNTETNPKMVEHLINNSEAAALIIASKYLNYLITYHS